MIRFLVAWAVVSVVVSLVLAQFCRAGRDDE